MPRPTAPLSIAARWCRAPWSSAVGWPCRSSGLQLQSLPRSFCWRRCFLLRGRGAESDRLLTASRIEAEATRARLADAERALTTSAEQSRMETQAAFGVLTTALVREQGEARALLESKLREMGEQAAGSLAAIRAAVEEQLRQAVERQMTTSFQRVADQVAGVQRAMADLQAVAVQVGDLKRLFSNVKSRGGWGEAQLRALLDDHLPEGAYETNRKLREGSDELVEFAIRMPARGEPKPLLAVDAKFPTEDYERLLTAAEDGDIDAERAARRALDTRLRNEARSIAAKYICPPMTVDFAVMYLPTDGLYMEAARSPGLIESCGREHRVLIVGPHTVPRAVAQHPARPHDPDRGTERQAHRGIAGRRAHRNGEDGQGAGTPRQTGRIAGRHDRGRPAPGPAP